MNSNTRSVNSPFALYQWHGKGDRSKMDRDGPAKASDLQGSSNYSAGPAPKNIEFIPGMGRPILPDMDSECSSNDSAMTWGGGRPSLRNRRRDDRGERRRWLMREVGWGTRFTISNRREVQSFLSTVWEEDRTLILTVDTGDERNSLVGPSPLGKIPRDDFEFIHLELLSGW
ncbi:hypothetical protein VTK26DRAFT_7749 [Humicola hyalothermophila]